MKGADNGVWIVIGILVLLGLSAGHLFSTVGGGFTTLSLQQVQFQQDPNFGQAWVLNVVQNGGGQYATGSFSASQVSANNKQAANDFQLKVNLIDNYASYPIYSTGNTIYKYDFFKIDVPLLADAGKICQQNGGYYAIKPQGTFDWYCLRQTSQGQFGTVGSPTNVFSSEIDLIKGTDTQTAIISNIGQTSAILGQNIARVQWTGNLVSGQSVPAASDNDVCAIFTSNQWSTVSCQAYNNWNSAANIVRAAALVGSTTDMQNQVNQVNGYLGTLLQQKQFTFAGGSAATTNGTLSNGQVILQLPKLLSFPTMVFTVNAQYLGIVAQAGQPKIVSTSTQTFNVGGNGLVDAVIKNVGTAQGSFNVWLTCTSPASSTDRQTYTLQPQESTTAYLALTASSQTDGTASCTVRAQDNTNPSATDSASIQVSFSTIRICTEGQKQTYGNSIQQCQNNAWVTIQTCGAGQYPDPITYQCVNQKQPDNTCFLGLCDIFNGLGNIGLIIIVILILLAVVFIVK